MSKYILIAYRPNHTDYCMNCEMGRSDSVFQMENSENSNEIIELWENFLVENYFKDCDTAEYEFTLIVDGEIDSYNPIRYAAESKAEKQIAEKIRQKWEAGQREKAEKEARQEAAERKQLEQLKAKYG